MSPKPYVNYNKIKLHFFKQLLQSFFFPVFSIFAEFLFVRCLYKTHCINFCHRIHMCFNLLYTGCPKQNGETSTLEQPHPYNFPYVKAHILYHVYNQSVAITWFSVTIIMLNLIDQRQIIILMIYSANFIIYSDFDYILLFFTDYSFKELQDMIIIRKC